LESADEQSEYKVKQSSLQFNRKHVINFAEDSPMILKRRSQVID
jgi:hypothetical protein